MSEVPQTQFALQRLYLSDVSFEAPNSPEVFMVKDQPHRSEERRVERV